MSSLKSNPLLKYLLIPVLLVAVFLLVKGGGKKDEAAAPADETITIGGDTARKLGVDGDTPADTLRTVVAESREVKEQIAKVLTDNQQLKDQNSDLQLRLSRMDDKVDSKLNSAKDELQEQVKNQSNGLLDQFQRQLDHLSQNSSNAGGQDMPIGLGVQPGDGAGFQQGQKSKDLIWVEPTDGTALDASGKPLQPGSAQTASGFNFPSSFGQTLDKGQTVLTNTAQNVGAEISPQDSRKQVRKAYTLPQNSTLMGSVAMSALIGRVPIDGTVNDPFPFKVMIGPDNLTANGIDLPDVVGAVASGTASGDWTLSCVRGQVRSLTFVFADGTIRSFPAPAEEANGNQNNNQNSSNGQPAIQGGLGWISDSYGIPCISGERRSNAKEYLTNQSLVTAAGAGIAKLLKADEQNSSTTFSSGGTSFGTTGSSGNSAMGAILTGGVSDIRSWMNKLYGEAFAAVYVQPGAKVAVHLDQQLAIDYEIKGRKVDYNAGANHVSANLD
ncbi:TIGR03752 family integrating conjugative element protein [Pseudomonas sp. zfem004]|uniref:TIGR03752 family integrating conjugative element protein n=1 Tax=Pseudomonas sp. zfem004 TaxID=3078199 RepID=UPI002929FC25|nr:TIGR03752 family integrating conjugative element protein [Pseudomonas sp. zfem004]MDU9402613.1 TIGR03752 family integrating conjugative element protein [Pseudomonas sp. zfem004]